MLNKAEKVLLLKVKLRFLVGLINERKYHKYKPACLCKRHIMVFQKNLNCFNCFMRFVQRQKVYRRFRFVEELASATK